MADPDIVFIDCVNARRIISMAIGLLVAMSWMSTAVADDDMQAAADTMLPGTTGVLLMYENTWAIPFVSAALDAGGTMIATKRIPAEDVIAVLDELDASD